MNPEILCEKFTKIYENFEWSMGQTETISGLGSTLQYTEHIRSYVTKLIKDLKLKTILDTSCGDWNWMKYLMDILPNYTGIDIVEDIVNKNNLIYKRDNIKFIHADFLSYLKTLNDKSIDLIICRHTCEHLPTNYNIEFINEAKRVSKFLLLTTHKLAKQNKELDDSMYRPVNLELEPYNDILKNNLKISLYDGPSDNFLPEMFINLYSF